MRPDPTRSESGEIGSGAPQASAKASIEFISRHIGYKWLGFSGLDRKSVNLGEYNAKQPEGAGPS